MVHAPSGPTLKCGDIILGRANDASHRYTLSTSGQPSQIACATYEEAIARAGRFAHSQHVDVWQTDDQRAFTLIVECRLVGSA